jgi:DNA polymerase
MSLDSKELFGDLVEVEQQDGVQYRHAPFYHDLLNCTACQCREEASKVIPGVGPQDARIIFAGRNPGGEEDNRGLPFVGRGGTELDSMLSDLGLSRAKVGIINVVKCHTDGDRAPKPIEIATCTNHWLKKELDFFHQAEIIFPLGVQAIQVFLGTGSVSPAKREGYWVKVESDGRVLNVCPLNHPGFLLRSRVHQLHMHEATLPHVRKHLIEHFKESYELSREG